MVMANTYGLAGAWIRHRRSLIQAGAVMGKMGELMHAVGQGGHSPEVLQSMLQDPLRDVGIHPLPQPQGCRGLHGEMYEQECVLTYDSELQDEWEEQ
jgi:hypothetical protein